ncbi:MAG: FAD-binding protein [Planctomycetes bacterium]|nr:FAD-binding protein [Planctomycetota bacterium]
MHPRPESDLVRSLRAALPLDAVLAHPDERRVYDCDGQTLHRSAADVVVLPRTAEEVIATMTVASAAGAPVVPRGAGTGLSGGTLAPRGGVMIVTSRMDRILSLDPRARRAVVQPGVINARLSDAARRHGLRYAPDPSSQTACTIGGNVAENSGGPHTLRLGTTTNHVTGLAVVTSDASMIRLGECAATPTEHDDALMGLVTGSEGLFGVVTEIVVRLVPAPEAVRTFLASYASVPAAGRAVSAVLASGTLPAAMELMDQACVRAVEDFAHAGFPSNAAAVVLIELEGATEEVNADEPVMLRALRGQSPIDVRAATSDEERGRMWKGRKQAAGALGRICRGFYTHDGCVPPSRLAEALEGIGEVAARNGVRVATLAHAGDGNIHPLFLFDTLDDNELRRGAKAGREVLELCLALGGSLTGEHGVGGEKRDLLPLQYDAPTISLFRRIRAAFDPAERMNPEKVFPAAAPGGGFAGTKPARGWL